MNVTFGREFRALTKITMVLLQWSNYDFCCKITNMVMVSLQLSWSNYDVSRKTVLATKLIMVLFQNL